MIETILLRTRAALTEDESPGRRVTAKYLRAAADEIDRLRDVVAKARWVVERYRAANEFATGEARTPDPMLQLEAALATLETPNA